MSQQNKNNVRDRVGFIGRKKEIDLLDQLITKQKEVLKPGFLIIAGLGGYGKTRLLNEIYDRFGANPTVHMPQILDFDDPTLHPAENVAIRIAQQLSPEKFRPYFQKLTDFKKIQAANVSREQILELKKGLEDSFTNIINQITSDKLVILRFDTTDALKGRYGGLEEFIKNGNRLKNVFTIIVGRDADRFKRLIEKELDESDIDFVEFIELPPLLADESQEYLAQKQRIMALPPLERNLEQTLLDLSGGKPILLDLAMEWISRGIEFNQLFTLNSEDISKLPEIKQQEIRQTFEKKLVRKITETRAEIHWIFLLISWIYPIDNDMLAFIYNMSKENAQKILKEVESYVFIKQLPGNRFKLHDEMQRMVESYVWPEVDYDWTLRQEYSGKAVNYFLSVIKKLLEEIAALTDKKKDNAINADQKAALKLQLDKKTRRLWTLREQLLRHSLNENIEKGFHLFEKIYDAASINENIALRPQFINLVEERKHWLSETQIKLVEYHKADHLVFEANYEPAHFIVKKLLEDNAIALDLRIRCFKLSGNIKIRQGKLEAAIEDFKKAVTLSKTNDELITLRIQATNALGWAFLELKDQEKALEILKEARELYQDADENVQKLLKTDYGLILNNLMVLLSENDQTRKAAINMANSGILYWKESGNELGLGMGFLAQGNCYHQTDHSEQAFMAYQNALEIFEPLGLNDWISLTLSWRGNLYHNIGRYKEAEKDLRQSLAIGYELIRGMTLNRLGRVCMANKHWDEAQKYIEESLDRAQKTPDYKYWITAVSRLIIIAAKNGRVDQLDYFTNLLDDCLAKTKEKIKKVDKNEEGVGRLGLALMALLQKQSVNIPFITHCLKEGITKIVSYGSWARRDVVRRLGLIEEDFDQIDDKIIRKIGKEMVDFVKEKEKEDISYSTAMEIMIKWKNWQRDNISERTKSEEAQF